MKLIWVCINVYLQICIVVFFLFSFNLYCFSGFNIIDSFYGKSCIDGGVTDINDIVFEDYSINLNTIGFPMLSNFFMLKDKFPILSIFYNLYDFIGYDKSIKTYIMHFDFFRTFKTIEWNCSEINKNISFSFSYSSSMNVNYNTIIRDLSASCSRFYTDTNILLGIHFFL